MKRHYYATIKLVKRVTIKLKQIEVGDYVTCINKNIYVIGIIQLIEEKYVNL